jgi:hypothetical protein
MVVGRHKSTVAMEVAQDNEKNNGLGHNVD